MTQLIKSCLVLALCLWQVLAQLQPQCAGRPFPSKVPLPSGYTQLISLDDYFTGNNLTYSVYPRTTGVDLPKPWDCSLNAQRQLGTIVASKYHASQSMLVILTVDNNVNFSMVLWRVGSNVRYQKYPIPSDKADRCTDLSSRTINETHFEVVADCRWVTGFLERVLVWEELSFERGAEWKYEKVDLFASVDQNLQVRLQRKGDYIFRAVLASFNSYVEIWSWSSVAREVQYLLDKTSLSLPLLTLKQIKISGNTLILLDYYTGIHTLSIPETFIPIPLASLSFQYYQSFTYDHSTNSLVLIKKGKVLLYSVDLTQSLIYSTFGGSYNLFKYQDVKNVIVAEGRMVVLGTQVLTIFSLAQDNYETRHAKIFNPRKVSQIYLMEVLSQGLQLLVIRNDQRSGFIQFCKAIPPILTLITPNTTQNITIEAESILDGHSVECVQSFELSKMSGAGSPIYDNGFSPDNEVLYVNLKGSGKVSLFKYGLGSRLEYSIIPYESSKLQYSANILKYSPGTCIIDNKPVNGTMKKIFAFEELLMVGFDVRGSQTLRYHVCALATDQPESLTNCTDARAGDLQIAGQGITSMAHQTMLVEESIRVVNQAYAIKMKGQSSRVVVKNLGVDRIGEHLLIRQTCQLKFGSEQTEDWSYVSQVLIQNNLLFVLQPYLKQIRVFQLGDGGCTAIHNITATTLKMGYFSPQEMKVWGDGGVLLVWQWDQLLALKVSGHSAADLKVKVISSSALPEVQKYTILTQAAPYLILISYQNNQVVKYHLDHKYQLTRLGLIDIDGWDIVTNEDGGYVQIMQGKYLSVLTKDKIKNTFMRVFNIDSVIPNTEQYLRVAVPNDEISIFQPVMSNGQVKSFFRLGTRVNRGSSFLQCHTNLTFFDPNAVLYFDGSFSTLSEYSQPATLKLTTDSTSVSHTFRILLSNVGTTIKRGKKFPPRGEKVSSTESFTVYDDDWFTGSVFSYEYICRDCGAGNRISFRDKVWLNHDRQLPLSGFSNVWEGKRKKVETGRVDGLLGSVLVRMRYNHSAWPIENNTKQGYDIHHATVLSPSPVECPHIIDDYMPNMLVSLCASSNKNGYVMSLRSTVSLKSVVIDEIQLQVEGEVNLVREGDILLVYAKGLAIIYTVYGAEDVWGFVELDIIDRQDIAGTICDISLLYNQTNDKNSSSSFTQNLYFLLVTQCSSKIYYTTFQIYLQSQTVTDERGTRTITIPALHTSTATILNLLTFFNQKHINIPNQAIILQTQSKFISSLGANNLYNLLFVFDRFHMYEFRLRINRQNGYIQSFDLDGVYYKYGQYQVKKVEYGDEEFMAVRLLSEESFIDDVLAVYDRTKYEYTDDFVREYHMFWAHSLNEEGIKVKQAVSFPWHLNGDNLVLLDGTSLQTYNISNEIHGTISEPDDTIYSQTITITARNPTNARTASVRLLGEDLNEWTGWEIFGLVVGVGVGAVLLALGMKWAWGKYRVYRKMVGVEEKFVAEDVGLQGEEVVRVSRDGIVNDSLRESEPQ